MVGTDDTSSAQAHDSVLFFFFFFLENEGQNSKQWLVAEDP
jgi:hypothetical protein